MSDENEVQGEGEIRFGISLLFSKMSKGTAKLNIPIQRTKRTYAYVVYCGGTWNITQV